jgi:hypothetical protein
LASMSDIVIAFKELAMQAMPLFSDKVDSMAYAII